MISSVTKRKVLFRSLVSVSLMGLASGCFSTASADGDRAETDGEFTAPRCISSEDADALEDQVLQLINLERAALDEDLAPVVVSPTLGKIAATFACRMVELKFFGHTDPLTGHGPGERAVAGDYAYFSVGENLAAGASTAAEAMRLWMESPAHRAIILDPKWKEVGIAVRSGTDNSIYWVQEFGDPADY